MEYLLSIILGVIQGITEWLPISSTGHLILFEQLWSMNDPKFFEVFKVVIQFGSILAVCVLYYRKLNPWYSTKSITERKETWQLWTKVVVGSLPLVIGLMIDDLVESKLSGPVVIAIALIVYGLAFILLESKKRHPNITKIEALDYKTAFGVGCFQMLAVIPGTSRSGSTILGASFLGCSRTVASEFSFFLAIPAMVGASGLKLVKYIIHEGMFSFNELGLLLVGTFVSFIVSIFAIRFLLAYIRKHDFKIFGYYRIILGIIVLLAFFL
ncbi:MAG: undecaprenyl-diphosphate phosphatase [Erysipelotrichia bacterium]|nr:undecaprenyl-diphosphate phosphatase [Erysipelotrichia bacterium]NCC55404.1 undecaprenyl-diphosphate phosphatase [Erysipelotrichia bacterium]